MEMNGSLTGVLIVKLRRMLCKEVGMGEGMSAAETAVVVTEVMPTTHTYETSLAKLLARVDKFNEVY
eukprot:1556028-Amphidinium_carterae.1